jgi:hypothetical protein
MSLHRTRTCRFCELTAPAVTMVRFGTRYAHPACGLDRLGSGFIASIAPVEVGRIPVGIAIQYGVLDAIERRLAA